jgi:hypothetical protein
MPNSGAKSLINSCLNPVALFYTSSPFRQHLKCYLTCFDKTNSPPVGLELTRRNKFLNSDLIFLSRINVMFQTKLNLTICSNNNAIPLAVTQCTLSGQKINISSDFHSKAISITFIKSNII